MSKLILKIAAKLYLKRTKRDKTEIFKVQQSLLKKLIKSYQKTTKYQHLSTIGDFKTLPIVPYEDIESDLNADRLKFQKMIVPQKPNIWEKTSGSSGVAKYIPYTPGLMKAFHSLLFVWAADIFLNGPKFEKGVTFLSLSAPFYDQDKGEFVKNHSFDDDSEYLPFWVRLLFGYRLVIPKNLKQSQNPFDFKFKLALELIQRKDLEIFFVWSPTYLLSLLDFIEKNQSELIQQIDPSRKERINHSIGRWEELWPNLKLISCWTDGSASLFIPELKTKFPNSLVQGKGLLATEAPMTVPLFQATAPIPLIENVFFEFLQGDKVFEINEIEINQEYEIVISHLGGLLRYRMGDRVRVVGRYNDLPCLKFLGRVGRISDMTGEKLNEEAVQSLMVELLEPGESAFLIPQTKTSFYYELVHDSKRVGFCQLIQEGLMRLHHYRQSVSLGQLTPLQEVIVTNARETYTNMAMERGMIEGDIKFSTLLLHPGKKV